MQTWNVSSLFSSILFKKEIAECTPPCPSVRRTQGHIFWKTVMYIDCTNICTCICQTNERYLLVSKMTLEDVHEKEKQRPMRPVPLLTGREERRLLDIVLTHELSEPQRRRGLSIGEGKNTPGFEREILISDMNFDLIGQIFCAMDDSYSGASRRECSFWLRLPHDVFRMKETANFWKSVLSQWKNKTNRDHTISISAKLE